MLLGDSKTEHEPRQTDETGAEMTSEESKAENVQAMGKDLGELYTALWLEVARLHTKWGEYVELFGTKESRIDLLNEAASDFAGKLQDSQFRDVLLDIACLTDRAMIAGHENLSVQGLPDLITHQPTRDTVRASWPTRYLFLASRGIGETAT